MHTRKRTAAINSRDTEFKGEISGTSANVEHSAVGPFNFSADTSILSQNEQNLNAITNLSNNNTSETMEKSVDQLFGAHEQKFESKHFSPSANNNISEFRDTGRIIALEQQAQRTENKLASLSYSVDELKNAQLELSNDMKASREEILSRIQRSHSEFADILAQQSAAFDNKYDSSMSAIATMIADSKSNNNNNSNTYSNNNINNRPTAVDTPYSSEVEFIPASAMGRNEPIPSGKELFPPSGKKMANGAVPSTNSVFVNIKNEPSDSKASVWYGAPSGTMHANPVEESANAALTPEVKAMIAEQAKALDEYKAYAEAHRAHLRQQSVERNSPLTDRKPPVFAGASSSVPAQSLPQDSVPTLTASAKATNISNEGSIRSLQDQLNLIQEILMARMDTSDSKEMKTSASSKNTKTHCSVPMHSQEDKTEPFQAEVKGCLPHEVPFSLKDLPPDLRDRIFKHLDDNKGQNGVSIKDGFINIPVPEQGMYHKLPEACGQPRRKGYHQEEDRSDTPIKARRAPSKERYKSNSYNNYYDNNGDPDDDDDDDGMPSRGPRHGMYHSPNPMRGKMYLSRDGREGISPEIRKEHEDRRMAIAGKYIQLHESLDAHFDQDNASMRLKMASKKDFPHVTLDDLELDSVISFFANYDLERGRHINLRWKMSMFISKSVLISLGVVASKNGWNMDRLPGGSAAHADDKDLRTLIHEEVRAKSLDDFMNKMNQVPYFERPEDEGFRPEAYTFDQFMKFNMNYADRYCARAEIIAAGAHGEHLPYIHKKDNVKGLFHSALKKFPEDTGIHLWEKSAFANMDLRNTKCLRQLFQKFFGELDPYKQGRLVSDDFNTVIKRHELVGKSLTARLNDARKDSSKVPEKGKRSDLNTTRIYGHSDGTASRSSKDGKSHVNDNITSPSVCEEDTREYTDEEFDMLMAAMGEEKIRPCHAKFQHGECEAPGCVYDHTDKAMQSLLKKRIWDLAKAAYRPEASKCISYLEHAFKTVDEEKKAGSKKTS